MRFLSVVLAIFLVSGCDRGEPGPSDRLAMAADYLWSQQAEDGGWHSEVHGILRGGQAWTPFVLNALLQVPSDVFEAPEGGVERGLQFLRERINEDGVLGMADSVVMEYPNYATAYALKVFAEHGNAADSSLVRRMADYLVGQQFTEQRGITPEHLAYGAWGFGETNLVHGQIGHVDLSHSRRVLQGLRASGQADSSTFEGALVFLHLIQKNPQDGRSQPPGNFVADSTIYDGGFYSSSVSLGMNKGGMAVDDAEEPLYFLSYASTTADGILSLLAAGRTPDDPDVRDAADWLRSHSGWSAPVGLPPDDPARWDLVMIFYHLSVRAEAYAVLGESGRWREEAYEAVAPLQHEDGSFFNPDGAPNKEDDPILATAMMVETLARIVNE